MQLSDRDDGLQIKVRAEQPAIMFGAEIRADGSESHLSDAVSVKPKKKKKKKVKGSGSQDITELVKKNTFEVLELENQIMEDQKQEDEGDFEFTMIGDAKPPQAF